MEDIHMSARNMAKRTAAGTLALAVCLGGGALALAGAAQADANFKFDSRIAGDDRYETAIAASKAAFPTDGKTENVVLVNGFATVDGLTASYLAGVANAPILYVSDKGADAKTQAEIKRLGVKNVWLVGGTTVIPQSVEDAIKVDYKVTRINGSDRYETAKLIAEAGAKISGKQPSKVFVASGTSFADALAVSPVAYAKGYAIALTEKDSTSGYTKDELKAIGADTKILVGGTAVVSDSVKSDLGVSTRVAGDDRAVTANLVADWAKKSEGFNPAQAALVGGTNGNGADSLVASAVLGKSLTTLHFAGWDATNVYLKDHAAELTGKGVVFGGKAAVNDDQVAKAQSAAQSVAAATGMIVTAIPSGSSTTFSYADPVTAAAKKATTKSTDKFVVSGSSATQGAFVASLQVGGTVSIVAGSDGNTTYSYTSLASSGYMTGLVGAFALSSSHTLTVVEPITGTPLPFAGTTAGAPAWDYTSGGTSFINYTVDGQSVSKGIFEGALSLGDTVTVSGTGADLSHIRTVALTSGSATGTIAAVTMSSTSGSTGVLTSFTIKTAAGATFTQAVTPGSGDTYSLDGTSVAQAAFIGSGNLGSSTASPVSVGDQITYSQAGGVQKFALVNSAPAKISGVVAKTVGANSTDSSGVAWWGTNSAQGYVAYSGVTRFVIDGTIASSSDFQAAVNPGDLVTYQAADVTTNTAATLTLTSKPLTGTVAAGSSSAHTVSIQDADGNQISATNLSYSNASNSTSVFGAGTSTVYTIDGTTSTLAQFDAMVGRISSGARTGTVQVSINNGVVTWSLATTVFSAAPSISSASSAHTTTITLNFNKPVTNASPANADWTVTGATLASTAPAWSNNNTTLTLTVTTATTAGAAITVAPASATAAAAYVDTYGTALGTSSITFTVS
ncbi:cell wall-binding repeat-containing protein [Quadrisphaera sp. INWT6]|uniref:cell wall-binding repeat-containing protein n=1 Tax=Quadrisphaera sp. INWT6 TaxID=2596917 RepID=UPI001892479D|nr:cell wall-binding repeat-containing protein [Quadrisphaera sp. INWT6]